MSQRVLIIDDEGNVRRMMRLALESDGYEVEDAADGTTGLDVYGDGSRFDAVLVDQHMPGMSGLEATRVLRANPSTAEVPIWALTARAMKCDEEAADAKHRHPRGVDADR